LPTEDFSAALWGHIVFKELTKSLSPEELVFLPADSQYYEDLYPGCLDSYKARIRFAAEVLEKADLIQFRDYKMTKLIE
jgi:hypothetical protein